MANKNFQTFFSIVSSLFATLLFGVSLIWILGQFGYQESNGKLRMIFVLAYVIILTTSGWLYIALKWRLAGFVHGLLMLVIAGLVLYGILVGLVTHRGADNAAAGIIAAANVAFVVVGSFAAICGFGTMLLVFRKS